MIRFLDIEIYDKDDDWAQARYLVHGSDDVLWTDNIDDAISFVKVYLSEEFDDE